MLAMPRVKVRGAVSDYVLYLLSDGLFPEPEEGYNPFEAFQSEEQRREQWKLCREEILAKYERECPGKFPEAYYKFDAKR